MALPDGAETEPVGALFGQFRLSFGDQLDHFVAGETAEPGSLADLATQSSQGLGQAFLVFRLRGLGGAAGGISGFTAPWLFGAIGSDAAVRRVSAGGPPGRTILGIARSGAVGAAVPTVGSTGGVVDICGLGGDGDATDGAAVGAGGDDTGDAKAGLYRRLGRFGRRGGCGRRRLHSGRRGRRVWFRLRRHGQGSLPV